MHKFIFFVLTIFALLTTSCKNDECSCPTPSDIYHTWEIVNFMSVESVGYAKDKDYNPQIEFKTNGSYKLELDANACMGSFLILEPDSIAISPAGCTKICCDSKFSQKAAEMLSKVETYSLDENELKLNVPMWGWLTLKAIK